MGERPLVSGTSHRCDGIASNEHVLGDVSCLVDGAQPDVECNGMAERSKSETRTSVVIQSS